MLSMNRVQISHFLLILTATGGCAPGPSESSAHHEIAPDPVVSSNTSSSTPGFLVTSSEEISQVIDQPDLKTIQVRTVDHTATPPSVTNFTYSSSFTVTSIAAKGQDDFYIAGYARNGDLVIEHWEIESQDGAIATGWQSSGPAPIGQPSVPAAPISTVTGGTYIPVFQRTGEPSVLRTEILRTNQFLIQNNAFGVDPEGRFLLLITDSSQLYRVDLVDPPTPPILLLDSNSLWTLPFIKGMVRIQVSGIGRIWVLGPPEILPSPVLGIDQHVLTYLYDADNDGLFEQEVVHDYLTLANSGLWDYIETDFAFINP